MLTSFRNYSAIAVIALAFGCGWAQPAFAAPPLYSNGFETDTAGWTAFGGSYDATRVSSGTNGVTSASGSFHAVSSAAGSAGDWGGYNFGAGNAVATAFKDYTTSVQIYLNVGGGWANDTRFDFDSAINNSSGTFLRDFAFNAGFYSDATGPGASTNRFVISASNNTGRANSYPKNPGRDPIAISTTGWYTFENHFFDQGGVLGVDLSIYDSTDTLIKTWSLTTSDVIGSVGGNRYGWFASNEFGAGNLAFDNASLTVTQPVPEPASLALLGAGLLGLAGLRRRRAV